MPWQQIYDPLHNLTGSALVAALPIVLLLALLAFFHIRAHLAALVALVAALAVAVFVFKMPASLGFAAAGYGAAFGLFPIGWIILNAIFIYVAHGSGFMVICAKGITVIHHFEGVTSFMLLISTACNTTTAQMVHLVLTGIIITGNKFWFPFV
jgi:lactate permease